MCISSFMIIIIIHFLSRIKLESNGIKLTLLTLTTFNRVIHQYSNDTNPDQIGLSRSFTHEHPLTMILNTRE